MNNKYKEDTIVALATPPGIGAISVVRVSGPDTFKITDSIFCGNGRIKDAKGYSIKYGKIVFENTTIDDVLISIFRQPNSYTGEDLVEISTHCSPFVIQEILRILITLGARGADPGEFTKRAFLNNKMDLAQAEAVVDVINSRTKVALRGARNQLDGLLSNKISEIREKLINVSSLLELELDFSEENIEFVERDSLNSKISEIIMEIDRLISTYYYGRITKEGVNVVLVGEPNVGKSSLLNYILKESRAIVSSIPGTTRDIIREEISIDGVPFRLFDTAGIREPEDLLEKEGVNRSREALRKADIVAFIGDPKIGFSLEIDKEIKKWNSEVKVIRILNKVDLLLNESIEADYFVCALTGEGINLLLNGLKQIAVGDTYYTEKDIVVSNIRHLDCLIKAKENLQKAKNTLNVNLSSEFISSDIRAAENALAEIIGKIVPDDVLNSIFSKFCVGK